MRKIIIYSLMFAMSILMLSACGSNSKEDPIVDDSGPYGFFNATTPLKIKQPIEVNGTITDDGTLIAVQLLKFDLVESGETIEMKPFDHKYGFLENMVVITDDNGYATFTYYAPENYSKIKGEDITIQAVYLENDPDVIADPDKPKKVVLTQDFVLQFR